MRKIKIIPMGVDGKHAELEAKVNTFTSEVNAGDGTVKKVECIPNEKGQIMSVIIEYDI